MADWISVKDTMPPPNVRLLVVWGAGQVDTAHTFYKWRHSLHPLGYLIQGHPGSHAAVTHWMLLPPLPSGTGGSSNG